MAALPIGGELRRSSVQFPTAWSLSWSPARLLGLAECHGNGKPIGDHYAGQRRKGGGVCVRGEEG